MFHVQVDEEAIKQLYIKEVEKHLAHLDKELVFWDSNELKRRTCMSWNTIQNTFFWEDDFPKIKLGGKWYYPAGETKEFLDTWLKEQGGES